MLTFCWTVLIFIFIKVWKDLGAWTFGLKNIMDQFNDHLSKRDKVIQELRQNFIFEKIKGAFFSIQYFKIKKIPDQIKLAKQDLAKFGISTDLINDDNKLYQFLMDLQQKKYKIIVDTKNHKFLFELKEEFQKIEEEQQEIEELQQKQEEIIEETQENIKK